MKRMITILMMLALCLACTPVSAVPYTQTELEEYMQAIYCEPVWKHAFEEYQVLFLDIDLDGRMELITMEAGEEYAPKRAEIYAFMDAEFSGRGTMNLGKLAVCRDPETNEVFAVSYAEENGEIVCRRLVYHHEEERVSLEDVSAACAARLLDYGYTPTVVTNADCADIQVYEDCCTVFLQAYQNTIYTNGQPPLTEFTDEAPTADKTSGNGIVAAILIVAAVVTATVLWWVLRRRRKAVKAPR